MSALPFDRAPVYMAVLGGKGRVAPFPTFPLFLWKRSITADLGRIIEYTIKKRIAAGNAFLLYVYFFGGHVLCRSTSLEPTKIFTLLLMGLSCMRSHRRRTASLPIRLRGMRIVVSGGSEIVQ